MQVQGHIVLCFQVPLFHIQYEAFFWLQFFLQERHIFLITAPVEINIPKQ